MVARSFVLALLVAVLGAPITFFLSVLFGGWLVPTVVTVLWAVLVAALLWSRLPPLAKEAVAAEDEDGVLVLLHGDDERVIPIATYYWKRSNVLEPVSRFKQFKFVPDPGSTVPVSGQRSKVAFAYVNYPFLISPKHILIAYDFKRLGFENIAQALDYEKYYNNIEELEKEHERWVKLYEAVKDTHTLEALPEEVRQAIPAQTDEEFEVWKEQVRAYIRDMERVIELIKKRKPRPVAKLGARFYTVKDVLGYLAIMVRPSKLASLVETARLEERLRLRGEWSQVLKYGVLIFLAVIGLIMLIVVLNSPLVQHGPGVQFVPLNITNVTGVG